MQKLSIFVAALLGAVVSAQSDSDIFNLFKLKSRTFQISNSGVEGLDGTFTKVGDTLEYKRDGDSTEHDFRLVWDEFWKIKDVKDDKVYFACDPEESDLEDEIDLTDVCDATSTAPPRVGYTPIEGTSGVDHLILLEVSKNSS